jgi:hypothetical protein
MFRGGKKEWLQYWRSRIREARENVRQLRLLKSTKTGLSNAIERLRIDGQISERRTAIKDFEQLIECAKEQDENTWGDFR